MNFNEQSFLCHYGVLGMKWGIRRYQNKDGSLTAAGLQRYGSKMNLAKRIQEENEKAHRLSTAAAVTDRAYNIADKRVGKALDNERKADTNTKVLKNLKELTAAQETRRILKEMKENNRQAINEHYNALVKEFGAESVRNVTINKNGEVSDGVRKGDAITASLLAGEYGGLPIVLLLMDLDKDPSRPKFGVRSQARRLEKRIFNQNK